MTVGTPAGATGANVAADQIWTYNPTDGWLKYFFYKRGTTAQWRKVGETAQTSDTFAPGTSFFFVRGTSGDTTSLTLSGAVKPLASTISYSVNAGETTMMCHAWPLPVAIASFGDYFTSGALAGATGANVAADQIWRYNPSDGWTKYFYYKRGASAQWRKVGETSETADTIPAGEGFFYVRGTSGDSATITFSGN